MVGGIATGAPLLGNLLLNGAKALARLTNAQARIQLAGMLKAALMSAKNFPSIVIGKFEIVVDVLERVKLSFKYPQLARLAAKLQKLQTEGVLIVKSTVKVDGRIVEKYQLIYKDALIAEGATTKELREAINPFFGKGSKVLIEVLDGIVQRVRIEELIKFLSKIDETTRAIDLEKFGIKALFRGTTKNADGIIYKGNTNSQLYGLSTSTDPLRAIVFAIEGASKEGRNGILQLILPSKLSKFKFQLPNRMVHYELEVIINAGVDDLSKFVVKEIPIDTARDLANKFFKLPENSPTKLIEETRESRFLMEEVLPKTSLTESFEFYQELMKL